MFSATHFFRWASGNVESVQADAHRPTGQIAEPPVFFDGTPQAGSAAFPVWADAASPASIGAAIEAAAHAVRVPDQRAIRNDVPSGMPAQAQEQPQQASAPAAPTMLHMADVTAPDDGGDAYGRRRIIKGTLYARARAFSGGTGFGLYDTWGAQPGGLTCSEARSSGLRCGGAAAAAACSAAAAAAEPRSSGVARWQGVGRCSVYSCIDADVGAAQQL